MFCVVPSVWWPVIGSYIFYVVLIQIVFEAVRGSGYQSDIALDEIKLIPGQCLAAQPVAPTTFLPLMTTKVVPSRGVARKFNTFSLIFLFFFMFTVIYFPAC